MADKSVKLKLTLSDGRIIESNAFTLPQGPVGPAGKDGANGKDGQQGPAGPATLPNYVSFEKPTSISVNASGGERTVTGVAEWEAAGEMKSGEYHIIDEEPLYMVKFHNGTANPTLGTEFADNDDAFNRPPKVNELFAFMWRNIISGETFIGTAYNISTGLHAIKDFITCKTVEDKKHLKHVIVTQSLCQICFDYLSTTEGAPASVNSLTSQLTEFYSLGNTAKVLPASGTFLFSNKVFEANHVEVAAAGELKITGCDVSNPNSLSIQSISISNGAINFYLIY